MNTNKYNKDSNIKENKNLIEKKDSVVRIPLSKLVPMVDEIMKTHPKDMEMLK